MRGLLVTGGEAPPRDRLQRHLAEVQLVAAADSGLETALRWGLAVDLVVGDMDSLADEQLLRRFPPERVLRYPVDKDESDTEIGVRVLRERGCDRIVIAGAGGGRTDHFLGVLALFERAEPPRAWLTRDASLELLESGVGVEVRQGETISFFPVGAEARVSRSVGLRWPLDGLRFRRGYGSLSNEATSGTITVHLVRGGLLMVRDLRDTAGGTR